MGDDSSDPIDHARATRQHTGETMRDGANGPGLIIMALGVMAMVFGLAALVSGATTAGSVAAVIALAAFSAGGTWLFVTHRRVRQQETDWVREHSHIEAPPPVS